MYGYVYLTTNLITGSAYIGKHKSSSFDPNYKGSGLYLKRAIQKYGWDNFYTEILSPCFSEDELNEEERFLIEYFGAQSDENFYNLAPGGAGGFAGGENHPHYHKVVSDATKAKLSAARKGMIFSADHRRHLSESISQARSGTKLSDSHRAAISKATSGSLNPFYGKHHSESTKLSISKSLSGRTRSEDTKLKISRSMSGSNNPNYGKTMSAETRAKISESNRTRPKAYHLVCKKCHSEFISRGPNRHYCDNCR